MTFEKRFTEHRAWLTLTAPQLNLARDIARRANALMAEADGELSPAEAVAIAAVQLDLAPDGDPTR